MNSKRPMRYVLLLILFNLVLITSKAQTPTNYFGITHEEDLSPFPLLFTESTDRNYTLGQSFTASWANLDILNSHIFGRFLSHYGDNTRQLFFNTHPSAVYKPLQSDITLYGTAFTPDSLQSYNVLPKDRPYAFIIGLSVKISSLGMNYHRYVQRNYNVGLIGNNIGKYSQTFIHEKVQGNDSDRSNPHTPRGWPHQISKSFFGLPTLLFSSKRLWLLNCNRTITDNSTFFWGADFRAGYQYYIGYYNGIKADFGFRLGHLDPRHWAMDFSTLTLANQLNFAKQNTTYISRQTYELYLLADIKPTIMFYNSLLEGQWYGKSLSDHYFRPNEIKNLILEWQSGIGMTIYCPCNRQFQIAWMLFNGRSPEFIYTKWWHIWGGVHLNFIW